MSEEIKVTIDLDRSEAKQSAQGFRADQAAMLKGLLADAEKAEKAIAEAAAKTAEDKKKAARDAAAESARLAAEEKKAAKETAEAQKKEAQAAAAEVKRLAKEKADAEKAAAEAQRKEARDLAEVQRREARETAEAQKREAAAAAAEVKRLEREKAEAARAAAEVQRKEAAAAAAEAKRQARKKAEEEAKIRKADLLDAAATLAVLKEAGMAAYRAIKAAAGGALGAMKEAADLSQIQLDKLAATKEMLREISSMTGAKLGPSDAEVDKHLNLRIASGATEGEAKRAALEFEGAGAAYEGVNLSKGEYKKAQQLIAKFAVATGGGEDAAGTYAKLGGLLLGLRKYDKAEDLLAAETQFNRILSKGVGENPVLLKQAAQVAGAYIGSEGKGVMGSERELAAVTATASRVNPEGSAEIMKSTTRVLRGFTEKWGPMLKDSGLSESDTYTQASEKLFKKMQEVEQSGRAIDVWLAEQGVDQLGATNLVSMYKYRDFTKGIMEDEKRPMTGAEAGAELDRKFKGDVTLQNRVAQAKLDAARLRTVMPNQYAKKLELEALTEMEKRGDGETSVMSQMSDRKTGLIASGLGVILPDGMTPQQLGHRINVEREMARIAEKRGLEVPGRPGDTSALGSYSAEYLVWLLSGQDKGAYSALGETMSLEEMVGADPVPRPAAMMPGNAPAPNAAITPYGEGVGPTEGFGGGKGHGEAILGELKTLNQVMSAGQARPGPAPAPRPLVAPPDLVRR